MILYLTGIDYKRASLSFRESLYSRRRELTNFWRQTLGETASLFTCNRIELYSVAKDAFSSWKNINLFQAKFPEIFTKAYVKEGNSRVIQHALRLSCGLESQVVGEAEILKQLNSWRRQDSFPHLLRKIWGEVLAEATRIRFKSGLNDVKNNIAKIIFKDLDPKREVVVIGTGKIAQLFAKHRPKGVSLYFASRKKHSRARQLARESQGRAVLLDELSDILLNADVVVSATASPHFILKRDISLDIIQRRDNPLYIYDLAVPRDIDPDIKNIPGIILKDLDDLEPLFRRHNQQLYLNVKRAQLLIDESVEIIKEKIDEYSNQGRDPAQLTRLKTSGDSSVLHTQCYL